MPDAPAHRPPKIGLVLCPGEEGIGIPRWGEMEAFARHAEAAGFDSLWVVDHLLYDYGAVLGEAGRRPWGLWECWSVLSALAAATARVELGTIVVCTGFRNPALLAKMADTVDEISGGRLVLGLGAGYHEPEYRAFGFPFDHRVGRFEEALRIIRPLLRTGAVDFQGRYYEARDCELRPRGPRGSGPPIMIGAKMPRMLRLVARYADLWNGFARNSADRLQPLLDAVDAACAALDAFAPALELLRRG